MRRLGNRKHRSMSEHRRVRGRRAQFRWVLLKERTARPLHRNSLCDALLALSGAKTEPAKMREGVNTGCCLAGATWEL